LENHDGINDLEKDGDVSMPEQPVNKKREKDKTKITETCDTEKCCLCDNQDAKKALITATSDEGISFARTCAVEGKDKEPIAKIGDDTILAMSICDGGDWNKVKNHDGIKFIEKNSEIKILDENND